MEPQKLSDLSKKFKKFVKSPETKNLIDIFENGEPYNEDIILMNAIEFAYIPNVKGRIYNKEKNYIIIKLIVAKIVDYNKINKMILIRLDDTRINEFWIEINISLDQINEYIQNNEIDEISLLNVRGRLFNNDIALYNFDNKINSCKIVDYDKINKMILIRLDDTRIFEFWIEINISLDQIYEYISRDNELDLTEISNFII